MDKIGNYVMGKYTLQLSEDEIDILIEQICFEDWARAHSGSDNMFGAGKLILLKQLFGITPDTMKIGEKLWKDGFTFKWDNSLRRYEKVKR